MNTLACPCNAPKVVIRAYDLATRFAAKMCSECKENEAFSGYVFEEAISQ